MIHVCSCLHKAKEEMDLLLFVALTFSQITYFFHFHLTVCNINLENTQKEQLIQQPFQIVTSGLFFASSGSLSEVSS